MDYLAILNDDYSNSPPLAVTNQSNNGFDYDSQLHADENYSTAHFWRFVIRCYVTAACGAGVVGSVLGLILLRTTSELQRLVSCDFLCALAVSSGIYLTCLLLFSIEKLLQLPTYSSSQIACKTFTFLSHLTDFTTSWLVVMIATDRVLVILKPNLWQGFTGSFNKSLRRRFIHQLIFACILAGVMFECWVPYIAHLTNNHNNDYKLALAAENQTEPVFEEIRQEISSELKATYLCDIRDQHMDVYRQLQMFECVVVKILPLVLVAALTIIAVLGYRRAANAPLKVRFDESLQYEATQIENNTSGYYERTNSPPSVNMSDYPSPIDKEPPFCDEERHAECKVLSSRKLTTYDQLSADNQTNDTNAGQKQQADYDNEQAAKRQCQQIALKGVERQVTKTLLLLTTLYVALNLPHNAIGVYRTFNAQQLDIEMQLWFVCVDAITWLMFYFYHATLFYFYIFWSPRMRHIIAPSAWRLLECRCLQPEYEQQQHQVIVQLDDWPPVSDNGVLQLMRDTMDQHE